LRICWTGANYRRRRSARDPNPAAILCRLVMPDSRIIAALLAAAGRHRRTPRSTGQESGGV
jgi:hypothetical protein